MDGLKEWFEAHSGTYDPATVIVELGNPIPEMVIQEIQLKECFWLDTDGNVAEEPSF